jgi:hypothetical protein
MTSYILLRLELSSAERSCRTIWKPWNWRLVMRGLLTNLLKQKGPSLILRFTW